MIKRLPKKLLFLVLLFITIAVLIFALLSKNKEEKIELFVYNWGNHISDGTGEYLNVNEEFEKRTGIKVNYTTYQDNESMLAKLSACDTKYDVIFPSDYMIGKLREKGMIQKLDFNRIPNASLIGKDFLNPKYDPANEYSVPYTWGLVGIFYNKELVDEKEDEIDWDILWKEKYKNKILMFEGSPRDTFMASLVKLGFSINTQNKDELSKASLEFKKQKHLIKSYVQDQLFDKISSKEAAIGPYYSDANILKSKNDNVGFVIPKSGTNKFVNAMCVPSNSSHPKEAMEYINFLCDKEIAKQNISHIGYSTPEDAVREELNEDVSTNRMLYPNKDVLLKSEVYETMPDDISFFINNLWLEARMGSDKSFFHMVLIFLILIFFYFSVSFYKRKKRRCLL